MSSHLPILAKSTDRFGPSHQYYDDAEKIMAQQWNQIVEPFVRDCNFSYIVDLAAGHGRNSQILLDSQSPIHLWIVDIREDNIQYCKNRFSKYPNIAYVVNNGYNYLPVPSNSITLVYCFDAMVHFDSDVIRSYLFDTYRILKPGGRAFFHHSNYTGGNNFEQNPGWRGFMSKELMAHYAQKEELKIVRQWLMDWAGIPHLDCLTLLEK